MSSSVAKIAVAFVAGLVLAVAGALVYVRMQDRQPPLVSQEVDAKEAALKIEQSGSADTDPLPAKSGPSQPVASLPQPAAPLPADSHNSVSARKTLPSHKSPLAARKSFKPPPEPVQVVENKSAPALPLSGPALNQIQTALSPAFTPEPDAARAAPVVPQQPHRVELEPGTRFFIRLGETLSSDHNYAGDTFRGVLVQPLVRDGFIIADRDSKVLGRVVTADKAGRMKGVAQLSVTLTEINTTDGQRIPVETNAIERLGQKSTGSDAAKIAGGAALGALIGALGGGGKGAAIGAGAGGAAGTGVVIATRGKSATLPTEEQLNFILTTPVTITEKINH